MQEGEPMDIAKFKRIAFLLKYQVSRRHDFHTIWKIYDTLCPTVPGVDGSPVNV
jgi:hypothetical protein